MRTIAIKVNKGRDGFILYLSITSITSNIMKFKCKKAKYKVTTVNSNYKCK